VVTKRGGLQGGKERKRDGLTDYGQVGGSED